MRSSSAGDLDRGQRLAQIDRHGLAQRQQLQRAVLDLLLHASMRGSPPTALSASAVSRRAMASMASANWASARPPIWATQGGQRSPAVR